MKILDLSAGRRAIWIEKECDLATFLDKRPEVEPDIICDTKDLPADVGSGYGLIVFDPPHMNCGPNSNMSKVYGYHKTADILETIEKSASEAHRVSNKDALMALKWNNHDISLDKALGLMSKYWRPLFGHTLRNMGGLKGDKARSQSYWVMLLRRDI